MDFLDLLPRSCLHLPAVWNETEKSIVDFWLRYANQGAVSVFPFRKGQLLSQQECENNANGNTLTGLWYQQFRQVLQQGNKTEQQHYYTTGKYQYSLHCTRVKGGIMAVVCKVMGETQTSKQPEFSAQILDVAGTGRAVLEAVRNTSGQITDFTIVQANPQLTRLLEQKDSLTGEGYRHRLPEVPEMFRLKWRVFESGEGITYQYHYHLNGAGKWFQITLSRMNDYQAVASFTDITRMKKLEEERQQQHAIRIKGVFKTAHAGMYTLIPVRDEKGDIYDFRFGLVNQTVASYLGLHAEDLMGSLGSVYFPAYKTNGLFDWYVETMKTGQPSTFDLH